MNSDLLCLKSNSLSLGSLGSYVHWANQIPMLTPEEEYDLATRLGRDNDLEAARRLIMSHLRLVIKIARGYAGYGLPQADLIQEGNIGLMKAVKRFNPEVGVRLVSFAIHWIRAEIHEYIIRNWRIVKIATTKAQRKLFFNLRRMSKERSWFSQKETKTVAEMLNVSTAEVKQMEARLNQQDESLDVPPDESGIHHLQAQTKNPEQIVEQEDWSNQQEARLSRAMLALDDRSQAILKARWLDEDNKMTLEQLANQYNISAERVRQLEKNALMKLQKSLV